MESTQGLRWDVVFAGSVALVATMGLFLGLAVMMRPGVFPTTPSRAAADVVWIRPAPGPSRAPHGNPRTPFRPAKRTQPRSDPAASPSNTTYDAARPPAPERPLSAIYLGQVRASAEPVVPTADPFADRHARLPGEGGGRFRMRKPTSVASVVGGIGRMFGGRDPDEPCRENRRNIGELALDGDSAALQQQLDYEHRLCRP